MTILPLFPVSFPRDASYIWRCEKEEGEEEEGEEEEGGEGEGGEGEERGKEEEEEEGGEEKEGEEEEEEEEEERVENKEELPHVSRLAGITGRRLRLSLLVFSFCFMVSGS